MRTVMQVAAAFLVLAAVVPVHAQTFSILHSFSGGGDGGYPYAGVTLTSGGSLYGSTSQGGSHGAGVVYKLTPHGSSWTLAPLYTFTGGSDGNFPMGKITIGPGGVLYGTTNLGGNGFGVVFSLRPPSGPCRVVSCPWTETVLYAFQGGTDGAYPGYEDKLIFDAAGNLYGTTAGDSTGRINGTVFELSHTGSAWTETILHRFTGGQQPYAGVTFDAAGNLYGTTPNGGNRACDNGCGTIYELVHSGSGWTFQNLYAFADGSDGGIPIGGLTFDQAGNLYGGTALAPGTIYKLTPSGGSWNFSTVYTFNSGFGPYDSPTFDAAGNMYGTVFNAIGNSGWVFKLTPAGDGTWTQNMLTVFGLDNNASGPFDSVVLDANGNIFGTTNTGGTSQAGTVWEISQ
jgi:uncharacterized repeat protein (TIGR03803 family)